MFPHNMAKNFRIIFNFFPHPIRSHGSRDSSLLKKVNRLNLHFLSQKSRNETKEIVSHLKCFIYQRNIVAKVATTLELLVAKLRVLVAVATVSVAISSPVFEK